MVGNQTYLGEEARKQKLWVARGRQIKGPAEKVRGYLAALKPLQTRKYQASWILEKTIFLGQRKA